MNDSLLSLPAHLRKRLASSLESGLLTPPYSEVAVRAAAGIAEQSDDVLKALEELERLGISGRGAAAWLAMLDQISCKNPLPDLVWSGPEVPGLHARDTRRVYEELLGSAERSVWASTYAFFDGPKAFDVLARRMDGVEQLQVTLLLNIARKSGDTSSADALVRRFAERFWTEDWPGVRRPSVFFDPRSLEIGFSKGVLHAKAVVTDENGVFITSANLTEAALDRNIEIGLLVRDRALAATLICHFRGLIDQGWLCPLPPS